MIEKANIKDINNIMKVIESGRSFLKSQGLDQWQDNKPNKEMIINDINNNDFYVVRVNNKIVACAAIINRNDPNYEKIYEGRWLTNNKYLVIHRFATLKEYQNKGYATLIINYAKSIKEENASIRIDTHINNIPMQNLLAKNGFKVCGKIYLDNIMDSKHLRLAYEYIS